jgi:pyruvate/oxaloacetate carboxyltransferase
VRRTQLYLDDNLWNALHANAQTQKTTISHLVREAVRERYLGSQDEKMKAMQAFVGIRKEPGGATDAVETVRQLRKGGRMNQLDRIRNR